MSYKEPQYNGLGILGDQSGGELGHMARGTWNLDPKRLTFTLARYKFAAKMLEGKRNVLEIGCGDAFASRIVRQHVRNLTVSDFDPQFVSEAKLQSSPSWPLETLVLDPLAGEIQGSYDGVYLLDVLEHIAPQDEMTFLRNIRHGMATNGVMVVGMPSIESQAYASEPSRIGHVNCKRSEDLKTLMLQHFENVFSFSMNDEVVHTGFSRMANYIFAVGAGSRAS